jgi:hypothetical protein
MNGHHGVMALVVSALLLSGATTTLAQNPPPGQTVPPGQAADPTPARPRADPAEKSNPPTSPSTPTQPGSPAPGTPPMAQSGGGTTVNTPAPARFEEVGHGTVSGILLWLWILIAPIAFILADSRTARRAV